MNLPNRLTVTRLVLAPVFFVIYFLIDLVPGLSPVTYAVLMVLVYGTMELTDLLDGKIARKYHLVTDLGKVMDPFGDVISHLTFFICLMYTGIMPVWAFIIIVWREFAQSFTRMLLYGKSKPMAANIFGKAKTCLYAATCLGGFSYRVCQKIVGASVSWMETFFVVLKVAYVLAAFSSVASYLIYVRNIKKSGVLKDMTR